MSAEDFMGRFQGVFYGSRALLPVHQLHGQRIRLSGLSHPWLGIRQCGLEDKQQAGSDAKFHCWAP
jgi:hypothetical protein